MSNDSPPQTGISWIGELDRRNFLKRAGLGAAALGIGATGTASAESDIYDGPFEVEHQVATVDPEEINQFDGGGSEPSDQGEGEEMDVLPRKAPEANGKPKGSGGTAQTSAASSDLVATRFEGLDATDVRGVVPPDPQVAANAEDGIVQLINSQVAFFDKSGEQTFQSTLDAFFAPATPNIPVGEPEEGKGFFEEDGYIIFDPRVRFDASSGRFIAACVDLEFVTFTGGFLLGVSSTSDPMDPWNIYYIRPNGADGAFGPGLVDYPELGFDDEAIYLTQNFFPGPFTQATMTAVDKTDVLDGRNATANHFTDLRNPDGSLAFTVQPADGGGYLANSKFFQGQTLTLWSVDNALSSTPAISNQAVRVAPYSNPTKGANQPNTEKQIDMGDDRVLRVNFDGSSVWTAHTINDGRARWYELDPSGAVTQANAFRADGEKTFFPSIASDGDDAVFVYNTSSPEGDGDGFVDAAVASVADGRVQQTETLAEGENGYSYDPTNGSAVLRWGDYNGCVPDPAGGFWVVGEYAKRILDQPVDPFYGTVIAKVEP